MKEKIYSKEILRWLPEKNYSGHQIFLSLLDHIILKFLVWLHGWPTFLKTWWNCEFLKIIFSWIWNLESSLSASSAYLPVLTHLLKEIWDFNWRQVISLSQQQYSGSSASEPSFSLKMWKSVDEIGWVLQIPWN